MGFIRSTEKILFCINCSAQHHRPACPKQQFNRHLIAKYLSVTA